MTKNVQFNLRIPEYLKDKVSNSAKANGRSINAEAQHRLEKSFSNDSGSYKEAMNDLKNFFKSYIRSDRLATISEKLNFLMNEAKSVKNYGEPKPSISRLSLALDHDKVGEVEEWFKGYSEPSFDQLIKLSKYFGSRADWLIHDEGKPFDKIDFKFSRCIDKNANELLSGSENDSIVDEIWFIRNSSKNGELIIVKRFKTWIGQILNTRVHVSNEVGFGGSEERALLSLTLKYLLKDYQYKSKVHGAIVSEANYDRLLWAKENPVKVIGEIDRSFWIDDIWDKSMYMKKDNSYWDGWTEMCQSNATYIELDDYSPKLSVTSTKI